MADDQHSDFREGLSSPANQWYDIVPSDSIDLDPLPRALYIGAATGMRKLTVQDSEDNISTFLVMSTQILPIRAKKVMLTDTVGVTDIIALL